MNKTIKYNNFNCIPKEDKSKIKLLMQELIQEDELLLELKMIANEDMINKIINEFKSTYHCYDFEQYLHILERCKKVLLVGVSDFNQLKKIIYKRYDINY